MTHITILLLITTFFLCKSYCNENCVNKYVDFANTKLSKISKQVEEARWKFFVELTSQTEEVYTKALTKKSQISQDIRNNLLTMNWQNSSNADLKRQVEFLMYINNFILPEEKFKELSQIRNNMTQIFGSIKIRDFHDPGKLIPTNQIIDSFKKSRNPAELKYIWKEYYNTLGPEILKYFPKYLQLKQEAASLYKLPLSFLFWTDDHEEVEFHDIFLKLLEQVMPLYKQLHTYMRFRLRKIYGLLISKNGPLLMHLTRDLTAKNYQWVAETTRPYKNHTIGAKLLQNHTLSRLDLYKKADDFFASMNFPKLPAYIWENSCFGDNSNTKIFDGVSVFTTWKNYRVLDSQTPEDLTSFCDVLLPVAKLLTYYLCEDQPYAYRNNIPEATIYSLGYLAELSAVPFKIAEEISGVKEDYTLEASINNLFYIALKFIPVIPNSFILYQWRRSVFSSDITEDDYNYEWWKLNFLHQGLDSPVYRSQDSFDPACRQNLIIDAPSVFEFLGLVIAHQLHKVFCVKFGKYDRFKPLHECSLYNEAIGDVMVEILKAGRSKRWSYLLEIVCGSDNLDARPLLEYYEPLMEWLTEENKKNQEFVGWEETLSGENSDE